jgi:undecaprenyl diphosphate synthase
MIKHLAFVMDGNRRWAKKHGLLPWYGHREGIDSLKRVINFCLEKQVSYASFYTLSIENLKRPQEEMHYLFELILKEAENQLGLFLEKDARVRFIGDRSLFPAAVLPVCERIEQATAHGTTINLNFLFCYGARQEIVGGIKQLLKEVQEGRIAQEDISDELFSSMLWTRGMPEPDLIIRTGGVQRLSNFLLYQAAYSEFYFLDCLWPEITTQHLEDALSSMEHCQRNFGL